MSVIEFALMQIKQEEQEECEQIAFYFDVLDAVNVEEQVPIYLWKT